MSDELPLRRLWEKFVGDVALAGEIAKSGCPLFCAVSQGFPTLVLEVRAPPDG